MGQGGGIYVEFVIQGNSSRRPRSILSRGIEASVVGPASAPQAAMARSRAPQAGICDEEEGAASAFLLRLALAALRPCPGRSSWRSRCASGIVRRHHRIVRRQAPAGAVFVRRQLVARAQIALQHLQLLAVFQADDVVGRAPISSPAPPAGAARCRRAAPARRRTPPRVACTFRMMPGSSLGRHRILADIGGDDLGHLLEDVVLVVRWP